MGEGHVRNNVMPNVVQVLRQGGIILYPTEGVYGLGCDPFNQTAVLRLLKIKGRSVHKGLVLIAASWQQAAKLISGKIGSFALPSIKDKPVTWVFPATKKVPGWLTGKFTTIAIRVTKHKGAKKICEKFGGVIVSTSANLTGQPPITSLQQIAKEIMLNVDLVVPERVGTLRRPTTICDAKSGRIIRK